MSILYVYMCLYTYMYEQLFIEAGLLFCHDPTVEGHARGTTNGFRTHGMRPTSYYSHMGEPQCGTVLRTTCPEDFTLLWSSALSVALTSLLI